MVSGSEKYCGTADRDYQVGFREAIASMIPSLIKRLEDKDERVRLKVTELIGNLENPGERVRKHRSTANRTPKPNFVRPLGA